MTRILKAIALWILMAALLVFAIWCHIEGLTPIQESIR